ncbi:bacterial regulatory helix-turn-helix, lysR family protein, partial [Vibrio harveyi]
SFP